MSKLLKKHLTLIKLFPHVKRARQKLIIDNADDELIRLISECCFNIERYVKSSDGKKIKCFKRYKKVREFFSKDKKDYKKKKQVLKQSGAGFLNALFAGVLPIITKLLM